MQSVFTTAAPKPGGHYSQAIVHGDLVFVAGQLAIEPQTGEKLTGPIEEQTLQALKNLRAILQEAGSDIDHVLKTTVFVADISMWGKVNQVYSEFFGEHRPARSIVPTKELNYGFLVEIEAIAAKKQR
jgi:2-iminobutanoate/2-iminopropanoate deaminase